MASSPRIRSVIVCDDARTEVTGKEILIGVYTGKIINFGSPPARLTQLCFRFEVAADSEETERRFGFQFLSPSNVKIIDLSGPLILKRDERAIIVISQPGVVLYESGIHKIRAGFDDNLRTIDTMDVIFQAAQGQLPSSVVPPAEPQTASGTR